jgi:hypothetical protein
LEHRVDTQRAIEVSQLPLARRYCELEVLVTDLYAALAKDPMNSKLHDMYTSGARTQAAIADKLGETVKQPKGGRADYMRELLSSPLYQIAEARRQRERLEAHRGEN